MTIKTEKMNERKQRMYQVDAFANAVFEGNPAAVCILNNWLDAGIMQRIAAENNLAETAFAVKRDADYEIRWFTPTTEVALCGHATLATAHVLFNHLDFKGSTIRFFSRHSRHLSVTKNGEFLTLDFPSDTIKEVNAPREILDAFQLKPERVFQGRTDYMLLFSNQQEIEQMNPDMALLRKFKARGIIITAPGDHVDFVSRFFAPGSGVDEDPVTGSAHTTLTPFWSQKLNKKKLVAKQLSKRGGDLNCELVDDRVKITGSAVTYLIGEIQI